MDVDATINRNRTPFPAEQFVSAQLQLFVDTLPVMAWFNPLWTAVFVGAFSGAFPAFGAVPAWHLILALGSQILSGIIGVWLFRHFRGTGTFGHRAHFQLGALQFMIGLSWGAMAWLFWVPGNDANHVLVFSLMSIVLLSYAVGRVMNFYIYVVAVAPAFILGMARFATSSDTVAPPLILILAIAFTITLVIASGTRLRFAEMLRNKLANDVLTQDLVRARDEALRKRFEAEAANASKTTFLANMSHELRTPLNAILGFSEIIAHETFGPVGVKRYKEYAGDIYDSGKHLLSIISDILDVAKIEAGRMEVSPESICARKEIERAVNLVMPRAHDKKISVVTNLMPGTPDLYADSRAFQQIVINLVTNAVKFTPEGGHVEVTTCAGANGAFRLCVSDNGPGIAPKMLERLFKPFNQIDNRYDRQEGGTGLGLSLVRGLTELHDGKVWIESEPGKGVRAYVELPLCCDAREEAPPLMQAVNG
ncbi:MAG: hypothetical protein GC166_06435 [Alphaproteobacteria bacterium]|nr:hypothetical protein [Alphaproteobacteria bacterium]